MKSLVPGHPLNQFVEVIWLIEQREQASHELALPTGTVELVVNLDDEQTPGFVGCDPSRPITFRGPLVCGVHSHPFLIDGTHAGRTLGVHFRPGGAANLLPVGLHETNNRQIELELISGPMARMIGDSVQQAADDDAMTVLEAMEAVLNRLIHAEASELIDFAVRELQVEHRPEISELVDRSGFSHRRFNELFRSRVGLTAKRFSSVSRFQQLLRRIENRDQCDWADLAIECSYYDQAHLIHEFQRHSNMTPTDYLRQRTDRFNHPVPGIQEG